MKTAILIPARMGSTRLPAKVMADINGKPMILHVYDRCVASKMGDVFVACDDMQIKNLIKMHGGKAILTDPNLPSGTDRIYAALQEIDPEQTYQKIINVQGDVPNISTQTISSTASLLDRIPQADITTPIIAIDNENDKLKPSIVKAILSQKGNNHGKVLYFTRATAPTGNTTLYEHIGVYVFRRASLERFVSLRPSPLEIAEKLEQLRALENDMNIYAQIVTQKPFSVDIPEDLEKIRSLI